MKYNESNKPLVCMMRQSSCYKGSNTMEIKGVLWHDTGVNNPMLKRYVQPDDDAADRDALLELLGKNKYSNDWNHIVCDKGVNAFVGKTEDGTVTAIQTLPWNRRPWGVGTGKQPCNNGWIHFEICQDDKKDAEYFEAAYKEAVELTAYLCKLYGIDPFGTVNVNGKKVPTILCHQDAHDLGLGSPHDDVYDWFKLYGRTMADVRRDVAALQVGEDVISKDEPRITLSIRECLGPGDEGIDVAIYQGALNAAGYSCTPDGDYGAKTAKTTMQFQRSHGITADGLAGPDTWALLAPTLLMRKPEADRNETPTEESE